MPRGSASPLNAMQPRTLLLLLLLVVVAEKPMLLVAAVLQSLQAPETLPLLLLCTHILTQVSTNMYQVYDHAMYLLLGQCSDDQTYILAPVQCCIHHKPRHHDV